MRFSGTRLRWIPVLTALSVAFFAVGCGSGESRGKPVNTPGKCEKNCPKAPGTTAAKQTLQHAAATAGVLNTARNLENNLLANAGGVSGGTGANTAGVASAATASNAPPANPPNTLAAANSSLLPASPQLGEGGGSLRGFGGSDGSSGNGSGGSNDGSSGGSGNVASVDAGGGGGGNGVGVNAAATAGVAKGGGGAHSGSGGGGAGKSIAELFGSSSGSELGGGSRTDVFGAKPGDVNPLGTEDPTDYFTRLGLGDNIFKIVERRYRNQAVSWARSAVDSVGANSRVP